MRSTAESTQLETCIEVLNRCRAVCDDCGTSRLANATHGAAALRCLRLIVQCAELCRDTAALLACAHEIDAATLRNHVRSCSVACERCRREIDRAGFVWAEDCIDACSRAATACATLLPTLPLTAAPTAPVPHLGNHN